MLTVENTKLWMRLFQEEINLQRLYLCELDTPIGDGDHGSNMKRGMDAAIVSLDEKEYLKVSDVFKGVAMALIKNVGGASGPLYGTAFLEMSIKAQENNNLCEILTAGVNGIMKRGSSEQNQKTMIDVWQPVIHALENKQIDATMIQEFANNTKELKALKGRASYVGERSIGHIDPGAQSSAYLFQAMLKAGIKYE